MYSTNVLLVLSQTVWPKEKWSRIAELGGAGVHRKSLLSRFTARFDDESEPFSWSIPKGSFVPGRSQFGIVSPLEISCECRPAEINKQVVSLVAHNLARETHNLARY